MNAAALEVADAVEVGGSTSLAEAIASAPPAFRRDPAVASKTGLDKLAISPAHYLEWCREDQPATPAMEFGRAFHMAVLEPDRFGRVYVVQPDFGAMQSSKNRAARDEWRAEVRAAGQEIIAADDLELCKRMADAIQRHELARNLIVGGQAEKKLEWVDPRTGLKCRGRADYHIPELRLAMDLKTCESASPSAFARTVAAHRYHVQDAIYSRGFEAMDEPIDHFLFLAVEKSAPYAVAVHYCDDAARERGEQLADRDMGTLARCVETNHWPAYGDGLLSLALPAWAFYD